MRSSWEGRHTPTYFFSTTISTLWMKPYTVLKQYDSLSTINVHTRTSYSHIVQFIWKKAKKNVFFSLSTPEIIYSTSHPEWQADEYKLLYVKSASVQFYRICFLLICRLIFIAPPQGVDPPPPAQAPWRQLAIIWTSKIPPSSPVAEVSDIAKPYQIYVKQRSCGDVNSPYKRNAELTQWDLYINHYSESSTRITLFV